MRVTQRKCNANNSYYGDWMSHVDCMCDDLFVDLIHQMGSGNADSSARGEITVTPLMRSMTRLVMCLSNVRV